MTDLSLVDTSIEIGNIRIHQPVCVFTSFIITAQCFFYYVKLQHFKKQNTAIINWSGYYFFMGLASIFGSISHAFFKIHEGFDYKVYWLTMQVLNIIAIYFAQRGTLLSVLKNSKHKNIWKWSYNIQLVIFIIAALTLHNFLVVVIDGVIGMVPLIFIHFIDAKNEKSSLWIASGISILIISALVNVTKFSFHIYFNHLDIAHVFIMLNLFVMYLGVKRIPSPSLK